MDIDQTIGIIGRAAAVVIIPNSDLNVDLIKFSLKQADTALEITNPIFVAVNRTPQGKTPVRSAARRQYGLVFN